MQAARRSVLPAALALGLIVYAAAMGAASFVPVHMVAGDLSQFSGTGDATAEITARFGAIAGRARLAALVLAAIGLALFALRHRVQRFLAGGTAPAATFLLRRAVAAARRGARAQPLSTAALLLVTAAGVVLRLAYLNRGMRHDEAWSYLDYARMPLYAIPVRYTDVNDHVLNTLLVHVSTALFGTSPAAVRLPAFVFGVLVIPAGAVLARALAGGAAALFAAALLATAVPLIEFSVNARGYEALTLFFLVILAAGHHAMTHRRRFLWAVVTLAGSLGMYTIPSMMVPLFAAYVWFALRAADTPAGPRLAALADITAAGAATVLVTALLYLPILIANDPGVLLHTQGIHRSASIAAAMASVPAYLVEIFQHWSRGGGKVMGALLVAAMLAGLVLPHPGRRNLALLALALAAAILLQLVLLKDTGPYRIWLPFLAVLLVTAGSGLAAVIARAGPGVGRGVVPVAALGVCLVMATGAVASRAIVTSDETAFYPPAQSAAAALQGISPADTIGITKVRSDEILYYALRRGIVLRPVRDGARLRYFRRVGPGGAAQGGVVLLVDGAFDHCSAAGCAGVARADIGFGRDVVVVRNDSDLTMIRAEK